MRISEIKRKTKETDIRLRLDVDGSGKARIESGSGFFDHMLTLFTAMAKIDLDITCIGDVEVDYHHSIEDIGIALGEAFREALGDKRGIMRYGSAMLPMDEALVCVALDFSGRSYLAYDVELRATKIGDDGDSVPAVVGSFDTELIEEFFMALTRSAALTLHVRKISGRNTHHILEAVFKGLGLAVRAAVSKDEKFADVIPSTKGSL